MLLLLKFSKVMLNLSFIDDPLCLTIPSYSSYLSRLTTSYTNNIIFFKNTFKIKVLSQILKQK